MMEDKINQPRCVRQINQGYFHVDNQDYELVCDISYRRIAHIRHTFFR